MQGIDPRWSDGLARMAEHAKAQGFGGLVLLVETILLWLAEKTGQEFVQAINDLNVIVDHNTGQRPAPVFVFVARQRNLQEFFPDLVDESKIHEQLDHHAKRFETIEARGHGAPTYRPRSRTPPKQQPPPAAIGSSRIPPENSPSAARRRRHRLSQGLYPFHPALIEILIDVTILMQRERSALRLLYELLVIHYPNLALGEFLPVGSAFDAIFPGAGVEATKKVETILDIHRQYYERLDPAILKICWTRRRSSTKSAGARSISW